MFSLNPHVNTNRMSHKPESVWKDILENSGPFGEHLGKHDDSGVFYSHVLGVPRVVKLFFCRIKLLLAVSLFTVLIPVRMSACVQAPSPMLISWSVSHCTAV